MSYSKPSDEGSFFISACLDKAPMLRDSATGDWIGTFTGHKGAVWSAKLNGDASKAATGSADYTVKLWDAMSGDTIATLEHKHVVRSVDFLSMVCPEALADDRLATGGGDKTLRIFAVNGIHDTAEPVQKIEHPEKIRRVLWLPSPSQSLIVTGTEDGMLRLWDLRSPAKPLFETNVGASPIYDMELSSDSKTITVAAGNTVGFYNASTLAPSTAEGTGKHAHTLDFIVEGASLHPDGKRFVAGGTDVRVRIYDVASGAELVCNRGHHGTVHCVRFSPDGETYASGADDATIRIWHI